MFRAIIILAVAATVPYLATHGPNLDGIWPTDKKASPDVAAVAAVAEGSAQPSAPVSSQPQGPGTVLYPTSTPLEGAPSISLHEVFRFDISKEWVYRRWSRKSTALAELGLYGVRVPLVTGTKLHDLAGSLTYYFNEGGSVERISFTGRTGDTTQLAMLMMHRYGLQPQSTVVVGEQLLQQRYEEHVFSELRTRPAPVLWANSPHDSFAVELELQRPGATTPLPPRKLLVPSPPAEQQAAAVPEGEAEAEGEELAADATPDEAWKTYSPRSRVPKEQVENLNRRSRLW